MYCNALRRIKRIKRINIIMESWNYGITTAQRGYPETGSEPAQGCHKAATRLDKIWQDMTSRGWRPISAPRILGSPWALSALSSLNLNLNLLHAIMLPRQSASQSALQPVFPHTLTRLREHGSDNFTQTQQNQRLWQKSAPLWWNPTQFFCLCDNTAICTIPDYSDWIWVI